MSIDPSGAPGAAPAAPDPNAALTDVRNQLLRIGQQIAEMRAEPGVAGEQAANGVIAELREAVRFLAERLDGVARMVAQRGEELADTRGALSAIDAHVRSQAETIGVLTTGMQALPSYGERVSGLQDNINGVQQRLTGIEGSVGSIGQRLGGIETAVSRPDSGVSERLAAIEGMLGPLSQRLGQSLTEHSASLQALHARVEALANGTQAGLESISAGTQAALAVPAGDGGSAVAELAPQLASLASELTSLRQDVATLSSTPPPEAPTVDLTELKEHIAGLVAARPAADGAPLPSGDVDAAVAAAERRIKDHVDDAVLALAQTLLGKQREDAVGAVAPVDTPVAARRPAPASRPVVMPSADPAGAADPADTADTAAYSLPRSGVAEHDDGAEDDGYDEYEDDEYEDDDEADDEADDGAPVDFSAAPVGDEPAVPVVAWSPAPSPPPVAPTTPDTAFHRGKPPAGEPFDQDADWNAQPAGYGTAGTGDDSTVVPERRRRWFSW